MRHWASFTSVMYIPDDESGFSLHTPSSLGLLARHTILRIFISPSTVLIWWRGRTVRSLTVSYSSTLMRIFLANLHLPFFLSITIGSVVLTSSIYIGTIPAFAIRPISSSLYIFDCWVPARQAWCLLQMYSGERGRICVFLKAFWVIVAVDSLKD